MTAPSVRSRYLTIASVRIAGALGAVLGVVLIARAHVLWPKLVGVALVLSALYMTASVSGALAAKWRSGMPPDGTGPTRWGRPRSRRRDLGR
ncbi:MAG: hypothetical protein ACRYFW_11470 [Janthinobacterium lividum]